MTTTKTTRKTTREAELRAEAAELRRLEDTYWDDGDADRANNAGADACEALDAADQLRDEMEED